MKKIVVLIVVLLMLLTWIFLGVKEKIPFKNVKANPDYICKKSLVNEPCKNLTCWAWSKDWKRVCHWIKDTEVSYYLIRTNCETWYTKVPAWWNVWWKSWRQESDYVSKTKSCSVVEYDHIVPFWEVD